MAKALLVGAQALARKDELVLRSLVKLLDGGARQLRLRFEDDATRCDVLFVPGGASDAATRVAVEVVEGLHGDQLGDGAPLRVPAPLRLSSVSAALEATWRRLCARRRHDPPAGGGALSLARAVRRRRGARRRIVLPIDDHARLVIDCAGRSVHGVAALATLTRGGYAVGAARRVDAADEAWLNTAPALRLPDVLWALAHELARTRAQPADPLSGAFRLARWPDAAGLAQPGHPRLAALLTSRAMSCEQLASSAGCSAATAHWFLATALALGIATATGEAPPRAAAIASATALPTPSAGLLGRLRERLKLW